MNKIMGLCIIAVLVIALIGTTGYISYDLGHSDGYSSGYNSGKQVCIIEYQSKINSLNQQVLEQEVKLIYQEGSERPASSYEEEIFKAYFYGYEMASDIYSWNYFPIIRGCNDLSKCGSMPRATEELSDKERWPDDNDYLNYYYSDKWRCMEMWQKYGNYQASKPVTTQTITIGGDKK